MPKISKSGNFKLRDCGILKSERNNGYPDDLQVSYRNAWGGQWDMIWQTKQKFETNLLSLNRNFSEVLLYFIEMPTCHFQQQVLDSGLKEQQLFFSFFVFSVVCLIFCVAKTLCLCRLFIILGIRRVGRRPDQQLQGEGKIIDRRPERRPPRERRFEKPLEEKGEGGEFSVDRQDFLISSYLSVYRVIY